MFSKLCPGFNFKKAARRGRKKRDNQPPPQSTNDEDRVINEADTDVISTRDARTDDARRENLWEVAGERLDDKYRKVLGLESASPVTDAIENVIKTTEEKYREYKKGGLKVRKRNGGHINVRDSAKNIIHYALQVQDIVNALVAFDPTGYASSAWSIVSIGLTMINNDIERRDEIFNSAEYLADILSYFAIVEKNYRERKVECDQGLEDALVEVYMAVLQYAAEVKKAQKESAAARVIKSITALVEQPFQDLKETVENKRQAVQMWTAHAKARDHDRQAKSIMDGMDEALEKLEMMQSHTRSLQDLEILDWLSTASYSNTQNNTQDHRASDTGNWFLNLPVYKKWKATPGDICWLYGAVGCGKSVLCSTVIRDIEELCRLDSSRKFAYWYFQFSNEETQKVQNMVRSILRQFAPRTLPASLVELWKEHRRPGRQPEEQKFAKELDNVLENSKDEFYLILDALDECPIKHDERRSLLQFLEELLGKHRAKVHILATSRPEPDIRSRLEQYQNVDLETGLGEDVETFVRAQFAHGRLSKWDESAKNRALDKLLDIPERRFRWADLQIKRLEESKTEAEFHKALDSVPVTLEDTYKNILERLSPDHRKVARTILIWLSFSVTPLDLKTVAAVVSFPFPEDVVTTCTTFLVTVNISDDTLRLAHFSVKEFLVRNETVCEWYQFSVLSGHDAIANKTIDCLLEITETLTRTSAERNPLLIYAARYWSRHLAHLGDLHASCTGLQEKVDRLFTERDIYVNWMRLRSCYRDGIWHKPFEKLTPPLLLASKKGLKPTVEMLLAKGANPMEPGLEYFDNALFAAAEKGHLEVLELLVNGMDEIPRGAIHVILMFIDAAEADKEKWGFILDLLWDKGALHDQSRASHKVIDETVVELAIGNFSKSGPILMGQLLDRKEKMGVRITESLLKTVLENFSCGEEIMHLLLNKCDADIKLTPSLLRELLFPFNTDAAVAVLSRMVNDIILDEEYIRVFAQGKKEAMELLLQERGEDIQLTQKFLITVASVARDPQTMRLLLDRREPGTDIDKDVLLAAAGNRSNGRQIMDVLLDECGQDTIIDDEIIQEIANNSYEGLEMMKALIFRQQPGFVVTEQTFCNATRCQGREMLQLLVDNARDSDLLITGETLRLVADNDFHGKALIEYLFDLRRHSLPVSEDVLVSVADVNSFTADDVLTFILERWSEIPVTDRLLEAACCLPKAMGLLLDRRHDCLPIEGMIHKIATDPSHQGRVFEMLLDRQLVEVDEWLMERVAGNHYILEAIRSRSPDFPVTQKIVINAARDDRAMRILLGRKENQVSITEEVIKASLIGVRPEAVLSLLLTRLGRDAVPITEDILIYAIQNNQFGSLRLLLKQSGDLDLSSVWEIIWQDPEVPPSSLAKATVALFEYVGFDVSDTMLERFPSEVFDDFIRLCMQHQIPLPTTEAAIDLIIERSSFNTIDIFLENHPDIPITERHIEAAESNPRKDIDKDALVSLLSNQSSLS